MSYCYYEDLVFFYYISEVIIEMYKTVLNSVTQKKLICTDRLSLFSPIGQVEDRKQV